MQWNPLIFGRAAGDQMCLAHNRPHKPPNSDNGSLRSTTYQNSLISRKFFLDPTKSQRYSCLNPESNRFEKTALTLFPFLLCYFPSFYFFNLLHTPHQALRLQSERDGASTLDMSAERTKRHPCKRLQRPQRSVLMPFRFSFFFSHFSFLSFLFIGSFFCFCS